MPGITVGPTVAMQREAGEGEEGRRVRGEGEQGGRGRLEGEEGRRMRGERKVCEVCGDAALGHNFGTVTCESCKAFFRRNAFRLQVMNAWKMNQGEER